MGSSTLRIVRLTLYLAWRLSATVGLYWLTSTAVGVGQNLILQRRKPTSS